MIASGIALHGGIMLTVNIPIFGELMVACYLSYISAAEWDAISQALDPRRWFRRREPTAAVPGRVDQGHAGSRPHFEATSEVPSSARRGSVRK